MPLPTNPTKNDGRSVAIKNENAVLKSVRHFGHLRRQEVATAVWPKSTERSAYVMAWRTVARLVEQGLLAERTNMLGGTSLVLTSKGVARLKDLDVKAHEGFELAYNGPQFFHRTLGTAYLLEKARRGVEVFGEYAILRGWAPVKRDYTRDVFGKIPDGLVMHPGSVLGLRGDLRAADWIEVESAFKPYDDVKKALSIFTKSQELNKEGTTMLNKLVFVVDARQRHHTQLLRYVRKFIDETPSLNPDVVLNEVLIAKADIEPPFVWKGMTETTVRVLLSEAKRKNESLDTDLDNVVEE